MRSKKIKQKLDEDFIKQEYFDKFYGNTLKCYFNMKDLLAAF